MSISRQGLFCGPRLSYVALRPLLVKFDRFLSKEHIVEALSLALTQLARQRRKALLFSEPATLIVHQNIFVELFAGAQPTLSVPIRLRR